MNILDININDLNAEQTLEYKLLIELYNSLGSAGELNIMPTLKFKLHNINEDLIMQYKNNLANS